MLTGTAIPSDSIVTLPVWLVTINDKLALAKADIEKEEKAFKAIVEHKSVGFYSNPKLLQEAKTSARERDKLSNDLANKKSQYDDEIKSNEDTYKSKYVAHQANLAEQNKLKSEIVTALAKKQSAFKEAKTKLIAELLKEAKVAFTMARTVVDPTQSTLGYLKSFVVSVGAQRPEEQANAWAKGFLKQFAGLGEVRFEEKSVPATKSAEAKGGVKAKPEPDANPVRVFTPNAFHFFSEEQLLQKPLKDLWAIVEDIDTQPSRLLYNALMKNAPATTQTASAPVPKKKIFIDTPAISDGLSVADLKADLSVDQLGALVSSDAPELLDKLRAYQRQVDETQKTKQLLDTDPTKLPPASKKRRPAAPMAEQPAVNEFKMAAWDTVKHHELTDKVSEVTTALTNAAHALEKRSGDKYKAIQLKRDEYEATAKKYDDELGTAIDDFKKNKTVENYDKMAEKVVAANLWKDLPYNAAVSDVVSLYDKAGKEFGEARAAEVSAFSERMKENHKRVSKKMKDAGELLLGNKKMVEEARHSSAQQRLLNILMSAALHQNNRAKWVAAVPIFSSHKIGDDRVPGTTAYLSVLRDKVQKKEMTVEECLREALRFAKERFDSGRLKLVRSDFCTQFLDAWRTLDLDKLDKDSLDHLESKLRREPLMLVLAPLPDADKILANKPVAVLQAVAKRAVKG